MFLRGKIYPSTGAMNLVLGIWNVKIGGIVIREKYHQIFILHLTPSEKCLIVSSFIFQHGSDPKHTANAESTYLDRETEWNTFSHRLASPKPGPQRYWSRVGSSLTEWNKRQPKSIEEFLMFFKKPGQLFRNEKEACLRGFWLCWKKKGGPTKYWSSSSFFFVLYTVFPSMFAHFSKKSLHLLSKTQITVAWDFYTVL